MLAISVAVKKWNVYLVGQHFHIKTDHYNLKFLLDHKATTPAQQSWVIKMMGYDYDLIFCKGTTNTVVDALSRKPQPLAQLHVISVVTSDIF